MSAISASSPMKAGNSKHQHSRSVTGPPSQRDLNTQGNPRNPHHLRQFVNIQNHQANTTLDSMDHLDHTHTQEPATPPQTPRVKSNSKKAENGGGQYHSESGVTTKKKKRNRKTSANEVDGSSSGSFTPHTDVPKQSAAKPKHTIPVATPARAAYAGPTFHASPAPSALPIPSFFSKSVPTTAPETSLQAMVEGESSDSSQPSPTRERPSVPNPWQERQDSPLDFFFKADREEKARAQEAQNRISPPQAPYARVGSTGSPLRSGPASPMLNPPGHPSSPGPGASSNEMFSLELEGNSGPGTPYGPSFATPYHQRMDAFRASRASPSSEDAEEQERKAKSQALKNLLFSNPTQSSVNSSPVGSIYQDPPSPSFTSQRGISSGTGPHTIGSHQALNSLNSAPLPPVSLSGKPQLLRETSPSITKGSASPRQRPSSLRQELSSAGNPVSVRQNNFTASPSPSTPPRLDARAISRSNIDAHIARSISGSASRPASGSQPVADAQGSKPLFSPGPKSDVKSMEEDLRRILKLDGLGGGSPAAGNKAYHGFT